MPPDPQAGGCAVGPYRWIHVLCCMRAWAPQHQCGTRGSLANSRVWRFDARFNARFDTAWRSLVTSRPHRDGQEGGRGVEVDAGGAGPPPQVQHMLPQRCVLPLRVHRPAWQTILYINPQLASCIACCTASLRSSTCCRSAAVSSYRGRDSLCITPD